MPMAVRLTFSSAKSKTAGNMVALPNSKDYQHLVKFQLEIVFQWSSRQLKVMAVIGR